jgi:CBS domain containing-hemolysin-like protein
VDSLLAVLVIAVLIALNGLFVAAEFAIVGAPRLAIQRRARAGHRIARVVLAILENPREQDRFIATAQLGITVASLGLGMYGEHVLATRIAGALESWGPPRWLAAHALGTVLSVTLLTYLHIVLGEMVPKSMALQRAEPTVLWITPPLLATKFLLYPLVIGLNAVGNVVLWLLRVDRQNTSREQYHTAEELEFVVRESQEAGILPAELGRLLHEIFEFGDLTAGEVMTPRVRVTGIPAGSDAKAIERTLRASPHTRYPLFEHSLDRVIGVVHVKGLLRLVLANELVQTGDAQAMPTVPATAGLDAVLAVMRRDRAQMALVMDEYGGTAGIVTLQDLFEEVVGRMGEAGSPPTDFAVDGAGRLLVPGTARLDEVGERLTVSLSHDDVDSVSGLVLTRLGRPPRVGETVSYAGLVFEVTAIEGLGVGQCAVSRVPPTAP